MAKNLFETLNKRMQQPDQQIGMTDQTQNTQSLLRAKLGKASSNTSVPAISNIQEQQAVQQAQNQQKQIQQQGTVLAQQETQQNLERQANEAEKFRQIDDKSKQLANSFKLQTDDLLNEFERGKLKLDDNKDASKTEQLAFQLRLQDQNYLEKLKTEGDLSRFNSAEDFRMAAAEQEVADNKALLSMGLDAQAFANMNDATFNKALATMDVNQSIEMFKQEQAQAKKMAKWKLLGSLVSIGSSAAGSSGGGGGGGSSGNTGGGSMAGSGSGGGSVA